MLRIENLQMIYPNGEEALKKTSLSFESGSFTVLLGTSGAGKSTLLRCLNFLNVPTAGTVVSDSHGTITTSRRTLRAHRKETAMIFQQHQLIERYTSLANVQTAFLGAHSTLRTFLPFTQQDKLHALECLDRVGLLDKALVRIDNLSGGQQQRVGIARALAQRPRLILADEPVASLDPETSDKVLTILHRIAKEDRIAAIVSLHQVELARKFADRVIGLAGGSVVFDGGVDSLSQQVLDTIYRSKDSREVEPIRKPSYLSQPSALETVSVN